MPLGKKRGVVYELLLKCVLLFQSDKILIMCRNHLSEKTKQHLIIISSFPIAIVILFVFPFQQSDWRHRHFEANGGTRNDEWTAEQWNQNHKMWTHLIWILNCIQISLFFVLFFCFFTSIGNCLLIFLLAKIPKHATALQQHFVKSKFPNLLINKSFDAEC